MTDKYDEIQQKRNTWEYEYYPRLYPSFDPKTVKDWQDEYNKYKRDAYSEVQKQVEIPTEMFEFISVLYHSANTGKYECNNWLKPDGKNSDHKSMCASMFRHLAAATEGKDKDPDSGLHPLLHLASRALMLYTRKKRGL